MFIPSSCCVVLSSRPRDFHSPLIYHSVWRDTKSENKTCHYCCHSASESSLLAEPDSFTVSILLCNTICSLWAVNNKLQLLWKRCSLPHLCCAPVPLAWGITNPDSLVIVLGDFNKGNLSHKLPKYKQFIKCPTREKTILDHCYTTVSRAYHAVLHTAVGLSDHAMVHLIPSYRQKLKLCKPVARTLMKDLQACLDCMDWNVFKTATESLDEYTEAVTSYISFCEDCCMPSRNRVSFNNDKPWFTAKHWQLRLQKEQAFRSGDRDKFEESKYKFRKAVSTLRNFNNSSQATTLALSGRGSDR